MTTRNATFFHAARKVGCVRPDDGSKELVMHVAAVQRASLGDFVPEDRRRSDRPDRGADGEPFAFDRKVH